MTQFHEIFENMQQGFRRSWFRFLFQSTALGRLLSKNQPPDAWLFYKTYQDSWWWNRLWFRSRMDFEKQKSFDDTRIALACVERIDDTLSPEEKILTPENRTKLAENDKQNDWILVFMLLENTKLLNLINLSNFNAVIAQDCPLDLVISLGILALNGPVLTQENFNAVTTHSHPHGLASALMSLARGELLTQENFQENFNAVTTHSHPHGLASAFDALRNSQILTQENFNELISPRHATLLTKWASENIWARIPNNFLTQIHFQRLLTAAAQTDSEAALVRIRDEILRAREILEAPNAFNRAQSTHTASVHRSTSASATKLQRIYGQDLNPQAKIQEIKKYVDSLENTPKHQAARRCIARITENHDTFIDSASHISTLQLFALAWTAIHDETKRIGSLEDAKALFVDALYETQRGYNLNAEGVDDQKNDAPICAAGTFNKVIEKLYGIHREVEMYYITCEGASTKFPKLAQAHAKAYLESLTTTHSAEDDQKFKSLIDAMKDSQSLEPIWENIKETVQAALWDEFKEAYHNDPNHSAFLGLINFGQEVPFDDFSTFEARLNASPECFTEQARLSREQGIWAHHSPEKETTPHTKDAPLVGKRSL